MDEDPLTYLSNLRIESENTGRTIAELLDQYRFSAIVSCPDASTAMDSSLEENEDSYSSRSCYNNDSIVGHECPAVMNESDI